MCLGFQVLRGVRARTVSASEAAEKFEPATTPATQHSETGSDTWTAVPCSEAEVWAEAAGRPRLNRGVSVAGWVRVPSHRNLFHECILSRGPCKTSCGDEEEDSSWVPPDEVARLESAEEASQGFLPKPAYHTLTGNIPRMWHSHFA